MPQMIHTLLTQYLSEVQKIYGAHLKSVILYGSYARGDYSKDSDIDVMILVKIPEDKIRDYINFYIIFHICNYLLLNVFVDFPKLSLDFS